MPRIFDNINLKLMESLKETLAVSYRADFCVGYFNLRGWRQLSEQIDNLTGGDGACCRLLIGMQKPPHEELRELLSLDIAERMDQQTVLRLKRRIAEEFRSQLSFGAPTNEDERNLRHLVKQLKEKRVYVKLFLRNTLHAKLYLLFRHDPNNPVTGFLGSSNLTFSGLLTQGELNVDVLDHDAADKLSKWFNARWEDRFCIDISEDLIQIINESWAREKLVSPYHIYLKMAYHLSQEARAGVSEFKIPAQFEKRLFDFQAAAVKIAAHHVIKRGGVMIGDVVGLGKTIMATTLTKVLEDSYGYDTLIICPKNLVPMWEEYRQGYELHARVLPLSRVTQDLPDLRKYRVVLIDESHNLRNREGSRYSVIQNYIQEHESKVILLTATPYNKTYLDLSSQLRLFVQEDVDLGIRPEVLIREIGETEFMRRYQCHSRSIAAFEKSPYPEDWQELMRQFMVRRTRSFIQENYAAVDPETGRKYLTFEDGTISYFPNREARTVKFDINDANPNDQYAQLYSDSVVDLIDGLDLPRYGLGNYIKSEFLGPLDENEIKTLGDLSRAGKNLMGFCRTNLFKRLESGGQAFIQSLDRHILRNYIYLFALEHGKPLPIGQQNVDVLNPHNSDADGELFQDSEDEEFPAHHLRTVDDYKKRAEQIYQTMSSTFKRRFKWLRSELFTAQLSEHLRNDADQLISVINRCGDWNPNTDEKLKALIRLLNSTHVDDKVLIFTQFSDTAMYLKEQLQTSGLTSVETVTGDTEDPTVLTWRFSPKSNNKDKIIEKGNEIRILIATDILSEGQNLQDCSVIVNYDLPWAIIRLIQRAGRVDRIGQQAEQITCYTFLPADGVERIIRLRTRLRQRLQENAEVVGTDEAFFDDESENGEQKIVDLYHERSEVLDDNDDLNIDLSSYAYQIWKNAISRSPELQRTIPDMPLVVYSAREHIPQESSPGGVLVYVRTAEGNDALSWVDSNGSHVNQSSFSILRAAECQPETKPCEKQPTHHELVKNGVRYILDEEKYVGGQLGRPSGARFKTYERLSRYANEVRGTLFESQELLKAIDEIYRYPLHPSAVTVLNRIFRSNVQDQDFVDVVLSLRDEERFCILLEDGDRQEPVIVCSLGLVVGEGGN